MKTLCLMFASLLLISCTNQQTPKPADNTSYDAALAQELGADDYGMRQYVMVILKTGPNDTIITDKEERAEIFKGHFSNMKTQAEAKKLALAGPFSDPNGIRRGLYIFNVKTIKEARELVLTDPAVKAGIFTAEFTPYYGSAALMQVNEIHTRIAKENP